MVVGVVVLVIVSVVNIDNGFGAGYQASLINHLPGRTSAGAQR